MSVSTTSVCWARVHWSKFYLCLLGGDFFPVLSYRNVPRDIPRNLFFTVSFLTGNAACFLFVLPTYHLHSFLHVWVIFAINLIPPALSISLSLSLSISLSLSLSETHTPSLNLWLKSCNSLPRVKLSSPVQSLVNKKLSHFSAWWNCFNFVICLGNNHFPPSYCLFNAINGK